MKEEIFKVIIINTKTGVSIERKISAIRLSDAQALAELSFGGPDIKFMII